MLVFLEMVIIARLAKIAAAQIQAMAMLVCQEVSQTLQLVFVTLDTLVTVVFALRVGLVMLQILRPKLFVQLEAVWILFHVCATLVFLEMGISVTRVPCALLMLSPQIPA